MDRQEGKGIENKKDILKRVDEICRENSISYTLLFETLLSQAEGSSWSSWLSDIFIGLLYPDYLKLLQLIEGEEDLYLFNRDKSEDYDALYTQICKRSRVVLPAERKKDQPYYDYSIYVYPILYAGNCKKELKVLQKKFVYYQNSMQNMCYAPFQRSIRNKLMAQKKLIQAKRRDREKEEREAFFTALLEKGKTPSQYVIIPWRSKMNGEICSAEVYKDVERCNFENLEVLCIKNKEKWLDNCFTKKEKELIMAVDANRAVIDGPETIRRVQLVALEILHEFDRICKKHNIKYILAAGTLLGAIRHKGFIPWDDDVDIYMLEEEWIRFKLIAEKELDKERFFLRTQETDQDMNLTFYQIKRNKTLYTKAGRDNFNTHRGIALDILPFFNAPDSRIIFFFQDKLCRFLKTMTWSHMGSNSERRLFLRKYYELISKVSNKNSYDLFYKIANLVKKKKPYLSYPCVTRNPYHKGFNQRKYFEDLTQVEFEGAFFPAPKKIDEFLFYNYGKDYMRLPMPLRRVNKHLPAKIELNGLYSFEN